MRLAAIDIGSNAARLLICQVLEINGNPQFVKLNLLRIPLRLGFDVFENGFISPKKTDDIITCLKVYQQLMKYYDVDHYEVCATSAMRDASNAKEVIAKVKKSTGFQIKIISGKEEAAIIFENHIENFLDKDHAYLYIDVGGGSTELTLFDKNKPIFEESYDIGTVRMLKDKVSETEWLRFKRFIKKETRGYKNLIGIGSGGNINKISSLSKIKQGKTIGMTILKDYYDELTALSVEERMIRYDLREDRADVIVPALLIYTSVMRWANVEEIYVPKFGLADGLVRSLFYKTTNS